MIVFPIDDAQKPSKVFVIELAQAVLGSDNKWGEGVLFYTVDGKKSTGHSPVVIVAKNGDHSEDYGYLFKAPYNVGDIVFNLEPSIEIKVLRKMSSSYDIEISFKMR